MSNGLLLIIVGIAILYLIYNGKFDVILDVLMNPKDYQKIYDAKK